MNISDARTQVIAFRYPAAMKLLAYAGLPILVGLGFVVAIAGIYLLHNPRLSFAEKAPGLLSIPLCGFVFWMVFMALRVWSSIFSCYLLDVRGLEVQRKTATTFLSWDDLSDARYRIVLGQIELRFHGFPGVVALNNVDMSVDRKRVEAALHLLEQVSAQRVRRTFI